MDNISGSEPKKDKKPIEIRGSEESDDNKDENAITWEKASRPHPENNIVDENRNAEKLNVENKNINGEKMIENDSNKSSFMDILSKLDTKLHIHEKNWLHAAIFLLLFILLIASLINNVILTEKVSDFRAKALSNANTAKRILAEKESMLEEYRPFKKQVTDLKKDLDSTRYIKTGLEQQNQKLKSRLADSEKKFSNMENRLSKYSNELKKIINEKLELHSIYEKQKKEKNGLEKEISKLEDKIGTLNQQLGGVDKKYIAKEAKRIYNMAFIYAKAGMIDEVIKCFKKYMELAGENADINYNLAVIYDDVKHDRANAIKYYKRYLDLKPDAVDLFEVKMKIESLERTGKQSKTADMSNFKINLNNLKY